MIYLVFEIEFGDNLFYATLNKVLNIITTLKVIILRHCFT